MRSKPIKRKIKIEVDAVFGSDFQEKFIMNCLNQMLDAINHTAKQYHMKNDFQITKLDIK